MIQVLASLKSQRPEDLGAGEDVPPPTTVVLMPAHNEASVLADTLDSLVPQLSGNETVLVVADNCTDETAEIARKHGAKVLERRDDLRRGKGYALAYGLRALADTRPDVVVILDADCIVQPGSLSAISRAARARKRPVQAKYLMRALPGSGLRTRMAAFAWAFRNETRARGLQALGLPCQLMGSGMAVPWAILDKVSFDTGHIVEDLKLGLDFAAAGTAPIFYPAALVESVFPDNDEGTQSQRKRWEHGHLYMVLAEAPKRLWQALARKNGPLLALTLDMSVPPLALLAMLLILNFAIGLSISTLGGSILSTSIGIGAVVCFAVAIGIGWALVGRRWVSAWEMATAPLYIIRKLPIYASFAWRRQKEWIKTKR